jgi:hypothetical protein
MVTVRDLGRYASAKLPSVASAIGAYAAQVVFILLSYTLRQWQLWKLQQEKLAGKTPGFLERACGSQIRSQQTG